MLLLVPLFTLPPFCPVLPKFVERMAREHNSTLTTGIVHFNRIESFPDEVTLSFRQRDSDRNTLYIRTNFDASRRIVNGVDNGVAAVYSPASFVIPGSDSTYICDNKHDGPAIRVVLKESVTYLVMDSTSKGLDLTPTHNRTYDQLLEKLKQITTDYLADTKGVFEDLQKSKTEINIRFAPKRTSSLKKSKSQ